MLLKNLLKNLIFSGKLREHKNISKSENFSRNLSQQRKLFAKTIPGTKFFLENFAKTKFSRNEILRKAKISGNSLAFRENEKRGFRFNPTSSSTTAGTFFPPTTSSFCPLVFLLLLWAALAVAGLVATAVVLTSSCSFSPRVGTFLPPTSSFCPLVPVFLLLLWAALAGLEGTAAAAAVRRLAFAAGLFSTATFSASVCFFAGAKVALK
jgi:hypothetical protein